MDEERTRHTLISRLKEKNDDEAWLEFSEVYSPFIIAVLRGFPLDGCDPEDLKQEVLLKIWKSFPNFEYDPERAKFRTWMFTVVKRSALNYKLSRQAAKKREETVEWNAEENSQYDHLLEEEWKKYLANRALDILEASISQQSVEIFRSLLKGENEEELAKRYSMHPNSINKVKHRVRARMLAEIAHLREELE